MRETARSFYTSRQKKKAKHIISKYRDQGFSKDEAEKRAWANVNKETDYSKKTRTDFD